MSSSQRRLSIFSLGILIAGIIALGSLWYKAADGYTSWESPPHRLAMESSRLRYFWNVDPAAERAETYLRGNLEAALVPNLKDARTKPSLLFPMPEWHPQQLVLPVWLLLGCFITVMIPTWMWGMNVIARHERNRQ